MVANHSGTLPMDAVMLQAGLHDEHPAHRNLRLLGADLIYEIPLLSAMARKSGHTGRRPRMRTPCCGRASWSVSSPRASRASASRSPSGTSLQRFGRGGFAAAAIRAGVPLVPCAIVGAEEIYPMIGNAKPVAELLRLPYFPLTPHLPVAGPDRHGAAAVQLDHRVLPAGADQRLRARR